MSPFRLISLHGVPRSGTSWLGKIFDTHPDVAYRFQPLFSYRFKGAIDANSPPNVIEDFLNQLYTVTDDEFILQKPQITRGAHPQILEKTYPPSVLVMKEVRYHYVIPALLKITPKIKIVGIVRHPCGVINSWLKTPREFRPEWDALTEWRDAPSKNQGHREEYYGFTKWKELTRLFLYLKQKYPEIFYLIRYESLVTQPEEETRNLLSFCDLDIHPQTQSFLKASQEQEVEDPDSVFRTSDVSERWKQELAVPIRETIITELYGTDLEVFL